jgi:prepilin-type N-terminal cleavage/methylation domain-containing protein
MRSVSRHAERGFSMVELLVAMTATLVVTGAVYGLVVAGNSAFRREPALADRQQNIRVAMDIIGHDLFRAGYGLPAFAQAFTDGLNGIGPMGSGGQATDELEIFSAADCPQLKVCPLNSDPSKSIQTIELFPECYRLPAVVLMGNDTEWDERWAKEPADPGSAKQCTEDDVGGTKHGHAVFPPGSDPLNPSGGFTDFVNPPTYMNLGLAIRYRIHPEADGTPSLERSEYGGEEDLDGNSTWQIIARGIEDLQVDYMNAAGWQVTPGAVDCGGATGCTSPGAADYDRLIRRVRVRLSARVTEGGPMTGETASAALPNIHNAVRGELVTEVAPRGANTTLQIRAGEL